MADARHVEFSPFYDDAQQALLDERFPLFLLQFLSAKKHTREDIPHEGKVAALFVLFYLRCILGHGVTKVLLFLRQCRIVHVLFGALFTFFLGAYTASRRRRLDNHDDGERRRTKGGPQTSPPRPDMNGSVLGMELDHVVVSGTWRFSLGRDSWVGISWRLYI